MRAVYNKTIKFNYLRGRVKFPTGGYSPRAKADLVKFQNRQYSLDDRRYGKHILLIVDHKNYFDIPNPLAC